MVNAMLSILVNVPLNEQNELWVRDNGGTGNYCVFHHPSFPNHVLEYVAGSKQDSITSLYERSPVFSDRAELKKLRNAMMLEIAASCMSLPSSLAFYDHGREREVALVEFGTGQLVDHLGRVLNLSTAAA